MPRKSEEATPELIDGRILVKGPDEAALNAALQRVETAQSNLNAEEEALRALERKVEESTDPEEIYVGRGAIGIRNEWLGSRRAALEAAQKGLRPFELQPDLAVAVARALLPFVGADVPVVATAGPLPKVDPEVLPKVTVVTTERDRFVVCYDVPEQFRTIGADNIEFFKVNFESGLNANDVALSNGGTFHLSERVENGVRRQSITTPTGVRYVPGSYRQDQVFQAMRRASTEAQQRVIQQQAGLIPAP